jgi:4-nitrophenyl phosphatase
MKTLYTNLMIIRHSIEPSKTLIIGDTISTDIAFGKNVGITTMLALSGVTTADTVLLTAPSDMPDYLINSLGDFRALDSSTDPSSNQASIS